MYISTNLKIDFYFKNSVITSVSCTISQSICIIISYSDNWLYLCWLTDFIRTCSQAHWYFNLLKISYNGHVSLYPPMFPCRFGHRFYLCNNLFAKDQVPHVWMMHKHGYCVQICKAWDLHMLSIWSCSTLRLVMCPDGQTLQVTLSEFSPLPSISSPPRSNNDWMMNSIFISCIMCILTFDLLYLYWCQHIDMQKAHTHLIFYLPFHLAIP